MVGNEGTQEQQQASGPRLVISCDRGGNISLSGPIDNLLLCYGLLEMAKEALRQHHERRRAAGVERVPFMPPGLLQ